MENYSLSDITSALGNNNLGNGSWWIIILFLFMMGGGNFWGNNRNYVTSEDMQNQFNFASLERQFDQGASNTASAQDHILQGINDQTLTTMSAIKDTANTINTVGFNMQENVCALNRNIDSIRYDNAQNATSIISAINADGEKTRALINENTIDRLKEKVNELSLGLSQCNQNAYLTNTLRPYPNPAWLVSSPYVGLGGTSF